MKFSVQKSDLKNAISKISVVSNNNSPIPAASCFLVKSKQDGVLSITATDMDTQITDFISAKISDFGSFCIKSSILSDICDKLNGEIFFELDGSKLKVTCENSKYSFGTLSEEDFPIFSIKDASFVDADLLKIKDILKKTYNFSSKEETRHYLNGVYIHFLEGNALGCSTDGNILSLSSEGGFQEIEGCILPQKLSDAILKLSGDMCKIHTCENSFSIKTGSTEIFSKVIDGSFPDYRRIMPKSYASFVSFDVLEATRAIERVTIVKNEKSGAVSLSISKRKIEFSSVSEDGEALEQVEADYSGNETNIKINFLYLLNALKTIKSGRAHLHFNDPNTAVLLKSVNDDNSEYLIMPMRG